MADAGAHAPPAPALSPLRAYRLTVAYDGTDFHGWQVQPDVLSVQGTLLQAARPLFQGEVRLVGASRTDAGVHALRQVVSVQGEGTLPAVSLQAALNAALPRTVRVAAAAEVEPGFDARRSALGKRYLYLIDNAPVPSPLRLRWAWHVSRPLDLAAMRAALAPLRGRHDFSAFCAAPGREAEPVCRVRAVHVLARKSLVAILVSADRFLHHMVRNVVGSAVEVGRGAEPPAWLAEVLRGRDRRRAGPTAPARGLLLLRVRYTERC
ncbi:MAG TPA: tRNA pseudouridine(38-40) synthase TruA [Methylomirabilota bacterium]|nr:tRNA pseudouridine(38-40) synthase TruA [Methylomirabilota bacterium]